MRNCIFLRSQCRALVLGLSFLTAVVSAETNFTNLAGEYAIAGSLVGDQVANHMAVGSDGGFIVWQDNATDGDGSGVSALRLNASLSGEFSPFRINEIGTGEQENPKVALLQNGGAAFVWQGGRTGLQEIYLRILGSSGVFVTGDVQVNSYTNQQQSVPSVSCLANGNLLVVWSSYGQDGSMQGVYARLFSPNGLPLSDEFRVNQTLQLNQRSPQVAALSEGGAVVVWASERASTSSTNGLSYLVDVTARVFDGEGLPLTDEIVVSNPDTVGSQPAVSALIAGGFVVGWGQLDTQSSTNGWDIHVRSFNPDNQPVGSAVVVNSYLVGDQFAPKLAVDGDDILVAWTSLAQDGSFEGIFARRITAVGVLVGDEFQVNTTARHKQVQPSIASDGAGRFVVAWSSFIGGVSSFDLFAQRFIIGEPFGSLYAPDMPFVSAISSTALSVTWPDLVGYPIAFYEIYVDGESPLVVSGIHAVVTNLVPGSTHSIRFLYQLTDGRRSPLSAAASGSTWGQDGNGDGLPDDWQISIWGGNPALWPAATVDSDGDGASNYSEFLAGTDPTEALSVLKTRLLRTGQGMQFSWTTRPGFVYQVQSAESLDVWQNLASPRFAHGTIDSINLSAAAGSIFYRVIRLR